jgi:hypothetical protein
MLFTKINSDVYFGVTSNHTKQLKNVWMNIKMNLFKIISIITSTVFIYLFLKLLLDPASFAIDIGLEQAKSALIILRRASVFIFGIVILLLCSMNLPRSKSRQYICLSIGIAKLGLACDGTFEFIIGTVNNSIF